MDADQYRRNAAACLRMAQELSNPDDKTVLLDMASSWLRLALQSEKNYQADLTYETPIFRVVH
jgi:hypothetical protein